VLVVKHDSETMGFTNGIKLSYDNLYKFLNDYKSDSWQRILIQFWACQLRTQDRNNCAVKVSKNDNGMR